MVCDCKNKDSSDKQIMLQHWLTLLGVANLLAARSINRKGSHRDWYDQRIRDRCQARYENSLVKSMTQRSDTHLPRYRYQKPQLLLPLLIVLPQAPVSLQFLNYRWVSYWWRNWGMLLFATDQFTISCKQNGGKVRWFLFWDILPKAIISFS